MCLNECPRNLVLASKADVLEYIEAAERGGCTHNIHSGPSKEREKNKIKIISSPPNERKLGRPSFG